MTDLKTEDLWLMKGDCLERMKEIPDNYLDFICMDLPYGTTRCKWDSTIDLDKLWVQLSRIAKDNCAIVLFAQTPFDKVLGASKLDMLKYEWIWEKTAATGHLNAKKMPMKAHENILVFYNKLPTYNPQKTGGHIRKVTKQVRHSSQLYGEQGAVTSYDSTERYPRSVLQFPSDKQKSKLHPTQKPLALLEYLVSTYSNELQVCGDFTFGSNTTGLACKNLNRKFIGIEMDDDYFEVGKERICNN